MNELFYLVEIYHNSNEGNSIVLVGKVEKLENQSLLVQDTILIYPDEFCIVSSHKFFFTKTQIGCSVYLVVFSIDFDLG